MEPKAPDVECTCGKMMKLQSQEAMNETNTRYKLKYTCPCGNAAVTLMFIEDNNYHIYVTDVNGKLLRHDEDLIKDEENEHI